MAEVYGRRLRAAALTVGLMVALGACGGGDESDDDPSVAGRGACDVVLDVTGHPSANWSHETLQASVKSGSLVKTCADRQMLAGLITDYSKANTCPTPSVDTYFYSDNTHQRTREQEERWAEYGQGVEAMFLCGAYGDVKADPDSATPQKFEGSDVFSAMQESQQSMSPFDGPKTLIIFSDMRNTMPPMKVPTDKPIDEAISELQDKGVIPDLQGTEVIVVGSGTSVKTSPVKQANIVDFWTAYFEAAGASVKFQESL